MWHSSFSGSYEGMIELVRVAKDSIPEPNIQLNAKK
jgi:hypothetical protein